MIKYQFEMYDQSESMSNEEWWAKMNEQRIEMTKYENIFDSGQEDFSLDAYYLHMVISYMIGNGYTIPSQKGGVVFHDAEGNIVTLKQAYKIYDDMLNPEGIPF